MKKSFLRILSITVTLLLIAGMVMMPASAAVPETGFTSVNSDNVENTLYRASDAADATAGAWLSSDSSVWKFAVGTLGDTFKLSSADFAAPIAEAVKGGGIKLSWTAPVEGKATVKIIGDNYNKEVITTASSITLGDTEIGKSYQVQVTVGDVSSQILAYNNIYTPISTKNPGNDTNYITIDRSFNEAGEPTNQWGWTVFNVADYVDLIGENTGFIFKVESIIDPEKTFNFTHYYDSNNQTGIREWKEYESEDEYINSADSGIAFNTYIGMMETNTGVNTKQFATNADTTRNIYRIDTTGMGVRTDVKTTNITNGSNMKDNFVSGYIIVPFDVVASEGIDTIKEYGKFSLTTEAFRYYPKNTFQTTYAGGTQWIASEAGAYERTDLGMDRTGAVSVMWDREIFLGDAGFISDIDAFIATCTDTSSAETANVDFTKLANSSETKDTVYLNTLTNSTLSDSSVASTYTVATNKINYTTASGEKMMLGFTAPAAGIYDVSCPITADVAKGVYTRVIKETAAGAKSIIQAETAYNGERHLALFTEQLEAGDTVWFEAWANSAATVIDLGIPQAVTYSDGKYSAYNYTRNLTSTIASGAAYAKETSGAIDVGYFINPITVGSESYDRALSEVVNAEGVTVVQDGLGIANLEVGDTATELYNRLTPYEFSRDNSATRIILASAYHVERKGGARGTIRNSYLSLNATNVGTSVAYSTKQFFTTIGYGKCYSGNTTNEALLYYFNAGTYFRFTAPADGSVYFYSQSNPTPKNVVLLHNSKVTAIGTEVKTIGETVVEVKKGDTVTLCLSSDEAAFFDIQCPQFVFTETEIETATVSFDQTIDSITPDAYNVGATIKLPTVAKNGAIFEGWNDGTTTYAAGTEYTVNADTEFTAQYIYYGDLDGVGEIAQAADVTVLRKMIIGAAETGATDKANLTGDIDANGTISLVDLVKLKKMSAGIDVTVGAK